MKLIEQARQVIQEMEKLKDIVHEYEGDVSGALRLGVLPTIGQYLLPHFVQDFISQYPRVYLHVEEGQTEELITGVKNGPLYYEEMFVFVSPEHPYAAKNQIEPDELTVDELWLLSMGNCFRNQVVNICNREQTENEDIHFTYESDSIESLKRIVKLQKGLTVIPEMAGWDLQESEKKMLKPFAHMTPVREISLVVNRTFLKKKLIDTLHQTITGSLPAHMLKINGRSLIEPY